MIPTVTFDSGVAGKHLLVFGGIHGDEICGPLALERLINEFESGTRKLAQGKITLAPVCNPKAYEQKKRYIDKNLNRVITPHLEPTAYEDVLAQEVIKIISDTQADALLDLHSYTSGTRPFLFVDYPSPQNIAFAESLAIKDWITGWSELYPPASGESDTTGFAHKLGISGLTIECGQHNDPAAIEVAYQTTVEAMIHFGLLAKDSTEKTTTPKNIHHLEKVIYRQNEGGDFTRDWQHLDTASKGTVLAVTADGTEIIAEQNSVILLPHRDAPVGAEWMYLGILKNQIPPVES